MSLPTQGRLADAIESDDAIVVAMDEVRFVSFVAEDTSCVGTAELGGCSVVMIASRYAVIMAHIAPLPDMMAPDSSAGDRHVRRYMDQVVMLYRQYANYFVHGQTSGVVSAWIFGEVGLPGQRDMIEQNLRMVGLSPLRHAYWVGPNEPNFPGRGTVLIDARGSNLEIYVEDVLVDSRAL